MNLQQLQNDEQIARTLGRNFTARRIRRLRQHGLIPFVRLGYRTILYDPQRVIEALSRFEVKAVSTHARREKASAK